VNNAPSSLAAAVDAVLRTQDMDLASWLEARVSKGTALRDLAFEIRSETGIPVSHETLRRWIGHYVPAGAA
jgi:transposase-like protein